MTGSWLVVHRCVGGGAAIRRPLTADVTAGRCGVTHPPLRPPSSLGARTTPRFSTEASPALAEVPLGFACSLALGRVARASDEPASIAYAGGPRALGATHGQRIQVTLGRARRRRFGYGSTANLGNGPSESQRSECPTRVGSDARRTGSTRG